MQSDIEMELKPIKSMKPHETFKSFMKNGLYRLQTTILTDFRAMKLFFSTYTHFARNQQNLKILFN